MNKLSFTTILVDNMDKALEFYVGLLGFEIIKKDHHYPKFVVVQQESFPIALHYVENLERTESRVILGIAVDDLAKTLEELKTKDVQMIHSTPQKFFGGLFAGIYDPSGNMLELIQWDEEQWGTYHFKG